MPLGGTMKLATASSPSLWALKKGNWKPDTLNKCQLAPNHSGMITLGTCKLLLLQTVHLPGCDVCNCSVVLKFFVCPLASWPNLCSVNLTGLDFWNPVCWEFQEEVMPSCCSWSAKTTPVAQLQCLGFNIGVNIWVSGVTSQELFCHRS